MIEFAITSGDALARQHRDQTEIMPTHIIHIDQRSIPDTTEDPHPFVNIRRGIHGTQKTELWDAVQRIYAEYTYDIIVAAFTKIDLVKLSKNPAFENETPKSLLSLRESFMITERIERTSHLTSETAGIKFRFLSNYKTFSGKSIRLEVPTIVRFHPNLAWQVLTPSFFIGGGNK